MLQMRTILTATLTATIGVLLAASFTAAAQSDSLDSLPLAIQDEISQVCLPIQFRDGAGAYRDCVQSELALRTNGSVTVFAQLSFDDKYAVQQACAKEGGQSSQSYQTCVATQISELNQIAQPALNELSEDELYVVQQSCFNAQSTQGAAKYRQCLNGELENLRGIPAADTSNLNMLNKNALQLRCSSTASNAVQYRQCVAEQYESITGSEPNFLPTFPAVEVVNQTGEEQPSTPILAEAQSPVVEQPAANDIAALNTEQSGIEANASPTTALPNTDITNQEGSEILDESATALQAELQTTTTNTLADTTNPATVAETANDTVNPGSQSSSLATEARVISRPELVETLETQEQINAQAVELEPTAQAQADSSAIETISTPNATPMQKLEELWQKFLNTFSSMDAIGWLLIAGVLALPALLLGVFAMIRGLKRSSPAVPEYTPPHDNRVDAGLHARRLRHEQDAATLFDDEMVGDHDAVTRIATKSDLQIASQRQPSAANGNAPGTENPFASDGYQYPANGEGRQSAFGAWLLKQPEANRMEACIEFLVYWVAYGDDRYQPDLKQRLFTDTELSSHDQIKRWVLKQDVLAFADVVGWLSTNASQKQLDQCIALLMALLVTEHSITPVQNTLLRFLSDAFNIGKQQLEQRFEKAFGHPMPPVPRTDKYAWWAKQQPEFMQRWEARFMATRAENEQMIARLGLTLNYDDAQVINAYRRAARRCHPDRFTELGDRERALAAQQFIKFEQARDKLLGVSV